MKLITAIFALALLAGSIDVEAQQRKNLNKKSGRNEKPETHQIARKVAEDGQPPNVPGAHLAILAFSELDEDDVQDLVEAAEEGDADAREELQLDQLGAIERLVDAIENEDERQLIIFGMMLGFVPGTCHSCPPNTEGEQLVQAKAAKVNYDLKLPTQLMDETLDNLHTQLSEELERMEAQSIKAE